MTLTPPCALQSSAPVFFSYASIENSVLSDTFALNIANKLTILFHLMVPS